MGLLLSYVNLSMSRSTDGNKVKERGEGEG